jgi:hypothetical protein
MAAIVEKRIAAQMGYEALKSSRNIAIDSAVL